MNYKEIKENPNLTIEEVASILLMRSCESARKRCSEGRGKYKNVLCPHTPVPMRDKLIKDKKFWRKWVKLTMKWVNCGYKNRQRPCLDRIDEEGHYVIGNIQALTHWQNAVRGTAKKCLVVYFNKNFQVECQLIRGLEKTLKKLGMSRKDLTEDYRNDIDNRVDYIFFNSIPEAQYDGPSFSEIANMLLNR